MDCLIKKSGIILKPFFPQLQTTFIKSIYDISKEVRIYAINALIDLIPFINRIDIVVTELFNGVQSTELPIKESFLLALQKVISKFGKLINSEVISKIITNLFSMIGSDEENIRIIVARTIGIYFKFIDENLLDNLLQDKILNIETILNSGPLNHGYCLTLYFILLYSPFILRKYQHSIIELTMKYLNNENVSIKQCACKIIGNILLKTEIAQETTVCVELLSQLIKLINLENSNDIKITNLQIIKNFSKKFPEVIFIIVIIFHLIFFFKISSKYLNLLIPPIIEKIKDRSNFPVKLIAERTLMHLLQIHENPIILKEFCQTLEPSNSKFLTDYCQRILFKLKKESDDENNENENE